MPRYNKEIINELLKDKNICLVDEKYLGYKHKHNWKCKCGDTFVRDFDTIKNKGFPYCNNCVGRVSKWTIEKVREKCKKYNICLKDEEFKGATYKHTWVCECGRDFERTWHKITSYNSNKCLKCTKNEPINMNRVLEVCDLKGIEFLDDNIVNCITKHTWRCACGNTFLRDWDSIKRAVDKGIKIECNECVNKKFESGIAYFAKQYCKKTFKNVTQEWNPIKSPKTNKNLYFDIFIEDIKTVIEIHGEQHYVFKKRFHRNKEHFEYRKWLDEYKKTWCLENGITYIEIRQEKTNIEQMKKIIDNLLI